MSSVLDHPVLVLNKGWLAIHIDTVREAIVKACSGAANIIHADGGYALYSMGEWMELPVNEGNRFIQAGHQKVLAPVIIVLTDYNEIPSFEVKLTRRNIMIRDGFTCQYSGRRLRPREATLDHIMPRSRGGRSTWENLVCSHPDINFRKGDKTPQEAGLTLRRVPYKPEWGPAFTATVSNAPKEWEPFLTKREKELFFPQAVA